jgi:hypothetical protein
VWSQSTIARCTTHNDRLRRSDAKLASPFQLGRRPNRWKPGKSLENPEESECPRTAGGLIQASTTARAVLGSSPISASRPWRRYQMVAVARSTYCEYWAMFVMKGC